MRKYLKAAVPILLASALLCSCKDNSAAGKNALIDEIVSQISAEDAAAAMNDEAKSVTTTAPETTSEVQISSELTLGTNPPSSEATDPVQLDPVDMDLTQMNATMIYSIIYDLMVKPNDYYGKSLIVDGYFDTMYLDEFQTRYFFVVVPDATACCVQGLEFKLPDDKVYPDDYPEPGTDIRVRGVLGSYEEAGQTYAYISADQMIVK